jgi:hypothetical protein
MGSPTFVYPEEGEFRFDQAFPVRATKTVK